MSVLTNKIVLEEIQNSGFDLAGFAPADQIIPETNFLSIWLSRNYHGGMSYMDKNFNKRKDIRELLPDARSVISLGLNYYKEAELPDDPGTGKISRYARGKDYHLVIWDKLSQLVAKLKEIDPGFEAVSYTDTGPVMDKAWAVRAGLGWMGKHTNIINKEKGSWFFIANIITNREFSYSPKVEDFCGSCTACLDACPTNALEAYILDARKCISYLTIENKEDIPEEFSGKFEDWIFGCDICQEVCPWNKKFSQISPVQDFEPVNIQLNLKEILEMDPAEFNKRFKYSPVKRAKIKGMKRNAAFLEKSRKENI